ncbi:MAG: hypothetical protein K0Q50_1838, partial [Vampirovibrio sp.]|nr:hypothetical protein [Vampirovibrio sp.]
MNKKLLTLALSLSLAASASVKSFADDQTAGDTANQLQVNDSLNGNDLSSSSNDGDDTAVNGSLNGNDLSTDDNSDNSNQGSVNDS